MKLSRIIDLLAIVFLIFEIIIAWRYMPELWQLIYFAAIVPLQTILIGILSIVFALLTWSVKKFHLLKIFNLFLFFSYRFVKLLFQLFGIKKFEEKSISILFMIGFINYKKGLMVRKIIIRWIRLQINRKILYSIAFFPFIIMFTFIALMFSKTMRKITYALAKGTSIDFLIKTGLKKAKKSK